MNPTALELKTDYCDMIDDLITHTNPVSDEELVAVFNGALDTAKTIDPTKGTPTVKHVL